MKHIVGVRAAVLESLEVRVADEIADADEEISTRARTSLGWAALVPRGQVEVSVEGRWVTLSGELEWHFQRTAARGRGENLAERPPACQQNRAPAPSANDGLKVTHRARYSVAQVLTPALSASRSWTGWSHLRVRWDPGTPGNAPKTRPGWRRG